MGFFRKKPFLEEEVADWIFESYGWLMKNFGGRKAMKENPLVEPSKQFFPIKTEEKNHSQARELFECVKKHAQMEKWPCKLKQGEAGRPAHLGPGLMLEHQDKDHAAGTYEATQNKKKTEITITYDPDLLGDPQNLIATFAHELGHYLTFSAKSDPPGGWNLAEPLADLAAIYLGFGLFTANSQFNFSQFQDSQQMGWQSQQMGYMTKNEILFSLAIYSEATGTDETIILRHIKHSLAKPFKEARKTILENYQDNLIKLPE